MLTIALGLIFFHSVHFLCMSSSNLHASVITRLLMTHKSPSSLRQASLLTFTPVCPSTSWTRMCHMDMPLPHVQKMNPASPLTPTPISPQTGYCVASFIKQHHTHSYHPGKKTGDHLCLLSSSLTDPAIMYHHWTLLLQLLSLCRFYLSNTLWHSKQNLP